MFSLSRFGLVGFAFGLLLWGLTVLCTGAGHGTYLPLVLSGAPLSFLPMVGFFMPPLMWMMMAALAGAPAPRGAKLLPLVAHLLGVTIALVFGTPFESADQQWRSLASASPHLGGILVTSFVLYVAGWTMLLYLILGARFQGPRGPANR